MIDVIIYPSGITDNSFTEVGSFQKNGDSFASIV